MFPLERVLCIHVEVRIIFITETNSRHMSHYSLRINPNPKSQSQSINLKPTPCNIIIPVIQIEKQSGIDNG